MSHMQIIKSRAARFTLHVTRNRGFTLLEMLVVIGIISVLVGMGITSYSTATSRARDARRETDLKEMQGALEQYYSVCGFVYPTPAGDKYASIVCISPSAAMMPTVPVDPRTTTPYPCPTGSCSSTTYKICPPVVKTEGTTSYRMETKNCTTANDSCCLTNRQ